MASDCVELLIENAMRQHMHAMKDLNATYLKFITQLLQQQSLVQTQIESSLCLALKNISKLRSDRHRVHERTNNPKNDGVVHVAVLPRVYNVRITNIDGEQPVNVDDENEDTSSGTSSGAESDAADDIEDEEATLSCDEQSSHHSSAVERIGPGRGTDSEENDDNGARDNDPNSLYVAGDTLSCTQCRKKFAWQADFRNHMDLKHGIRSPYECNFNLCQKRFRERWALISHIGIKHQQKGKFECKICQKQFSCKSKLEAHKMSHGNIRPHKCRQCGKKFKLKSQVSTHKRSVHEKEIRFKCEICGKGFWRRDRYTKHCRIHDQQRPCACGHCKKRFHTVQLKKEHEKKCKSKRK